VKYFYLLHTLDEKTFLKMDSTDKKILNIIQKDFPVVAEPFKVLAEKLGLNEDEVLSGEADI